MSPTNLSGPIRVSPNRRYFVDAQGKPFFWLGDTAWPFFASYSPQAAENHLVNRANKGFNVIQCVLAWGDPQPPNLEGTPPKANWRGQSPWRTSPAEPNPDYFDDAEALLRKAQDLGIVLAVLPTWGYHVQNSRVFDPQNGYAYGEWLGRRFRHAPNLVWVNGGDREPLGFEETWRAIARGLRAGDEGAHLITYHPCGFRSSSYYFHHEDWLDFNMIETWTAWPAVYPAVAADRALDPARPVVLGEGAYEDGPEYPLGPITPLVTRRQAWWAVMAGGFYTYGQNQMWRMEPGWQAALDTPGAFQMGVMRSILERFPWWTLMPDQTLLDEGAGSGRTFNAAMRTPDRQLGLVYLSCQCHALVRIDRIAAPRVRATWFNPVNGEQVPAGEFATGNNLPGETFPRGTSQWFSVPGYWEDGVLALQALV